MPRRPCLFRETDVSRAFRAARAAGIANPRVEISKDGSISVWAGKPDDVEAQEATNPWDKVLTDAAHEKRTA
jgi:hypothetical protein